jgi:hypothetical protein
VNVRTSLVAVRYAMATGFADFATTYTWRTWLLGWCSRVLCQVAFFALVGRMLGGAWQSRPGRCSCSRRGPARRVRHDHARLVQRRSLTVRTIDGCP